METFSSTALTLAMIASFLLAFGGVRLALQKETRSRGLLMLTAAAVIFVNVLIWTL